MEDLFDSINPEILHRIACDHAENQYLSGRDISARDIAWALDWVAMTVENARALTRILLGEATLDSVTFDGHAVLRIRDGYDCQALRESEVIARTRYVMDSRKG